MLLYLAMVYLLIKQSYSTRIYWRYIIIKYNSFFLVISLYQKLNVFRFVYIFHVMYKDLWLEHWELCYVEVDALVVSKAWCCLSFFCITFFLLHYSPHIFLILLIPFSFLWFFFVKGIYIFFIIITFCACISNID